MSRGSRVLQTVVLAGAFLVWLPIASGGMEAARGESNEAEDSETVENADPIGADAQRLADDLGVPENLAKEYLERQPVVGDLDAYLAASGPESYGGLYILYHPQYAVVVLSTTGDQVEMHSALADGGFEVLAPFVVLRTVDYTTDSLQRTIQLVEERAPDVAFVADGDIRYGTVWFSTATQADAGLLSKIIDKSSLPVPSARIEVEAAGLMTDQVNSLGGLNLNHQDGTPECTSGFSVEPTDGTGQDGVSTAAHCPNLLEFQNGDDIDYIDCQEGGNLDAQWHRTPGREDKPWVKDSADTHRVITGRRQRSEQPIDGFVCLTRRDNDVRCGYIESKIFDPGSGFEATFIRVNGLSQDLSVGGDSGGPWWSGQLAYGIHRSEPVADPWDAVYTAQNYLGQLNRRVKIG